MPTYEYDCEACGHSFDELQSFSAEPLKKCPACKKPKLRRRSAPARPSCSRAPASTRPTTAASPTRRARRPRPRRPSRRRMSRNRRNRLPRPNRPRVRTVRPARKARPVRSSRQVTEFEPFGQNVQVGTAGRPMIRTRRPICDQPLRAAREADLPFLPFCSDRCRRDHLGRWLGESLPIEEPDSRPPRTTT